MNKALSILLVFFAAFCSTVEAAERITATITVTNAPVTSNSLTINATFRYWTNASALGTIQTNLTGKNAAATNLYNQIASYPYPGGVILQWADTNQIRLIGPVGGALAASLSGTWGTIALSTQSGPQTYTALWPMENMVGTTNRTNQGSALVSGLSTYSTNAFATNSTALSNFLTRGASPVQTVISPVQLSGTVGLSVGSLTNVSIYNGTNRGYVVALTNGYWTNGTLANPAMTNATNYGLAFSSPGAYPSSQQFGGGLATAGYGMAIGEGSSAGTNSLAVGYLAAAGHYTIAIGNGADASVGTNGVALGQNTSLGASSNAVALGQGANVGDRHHNSAAIGQGASTSTNNQIRLGSSLHTVSIPGIIDGPTGTNATLRGTNILNGRLDVTPRSNTTLANGYNSGVVFGTNLWVEFSGPSAAYTNAGFAAPGGPQLVWGQFDNPGLSFTLLNESGLEATAANRITTDTGALLNSTNRTVFVGFKYDTTTSRWRVISFR